VAFWCVYEVPLFPGAPSPSTHPLLISLDPQLSSSSPEQSRRIVSSSTYMHGQGIATLPPYH